MSGTTNAAIAAAFASVWAKARTGGGTCLLATACCGAVYFVLSRPFLKHLPALLNVIELVSGTRAGNGNLRCRDRRAKTELLLAETNPKTRREFEKPLFWRKKCEQAGSSSSPTTGWWAPSSSLAVSTTRS